MEDNDLTIEKQLSQYISDNAEKFVEEWIEWLRERVNTDLIQSLPDNAIRNHIPPVILSLAKYVHTPLELIRSEVIGHLNLHGRIRVQQGYQIEELLSEFEGLAAMISAAALEHLSTLSSTNQEQSKLVALNNLTTGLRSIGYITVAIYKEAEFAHEKLLANHLQDFADNIAHEMNSPLQAISLGATLLLDEKIHLDKDKRKEHLKIIKQAISHTSDLLDNLHVLALIHGSKASGKMVEVKSTIEAIARNLKHLAAEKDVTIEQSDSIPEVAVSSLPIHVCLVNLIINSIKYHDPKKNKRWCKIKAKLITMKGKTTSCEITVEDNGVGIPDDIIDNIFTRKLRGHTHLASGTGLGLSISRSIISEYSGDINIESKHGKGTLVKFRLPCAQIHARSNEEITSQDIAQLSVENVYTPTPEP